jgi:chromosome segregation ATPase
MGKKENDQEKLGAADKGVSDPVPGGEGDATRDKTIRILEEMNRKLLARVMQLELKQAGATEQQEGEAVEQEEAEENRRFSTMVKSLRGDIDAAYVLKKALETDLAATQTRLSEEEAARQQFESRAGLFEAKAALADQLREDITFVEGEQNRTFRRLAEATSERERVTEERDKLAEAKRLRDARISELLKQRFELEADIVELKERLEEMVSFFSQKSKPSSP